MNFHSKHQLETQAGLYGEQNVQLMMTFIFDYSGSQLPRLNVYIHTGHKSDVI